MRKIVGVMGASKATEDDINRAEELGKLIAQNGWVTLNGGYCEGIVQAVSKGAKESGGLVVGVLNGDNTKQASEYIDIAIVTGMGNARNNINVLSSDVVVACGTLSAGTLSEVSLAISAHRPIILLGPKDVLKEEVEKLARANITTVTTPEVAIEKIKNIFSE